MYPRVAEIQKRERKRRGRAAQEARAAKKEARLEQDRTDRIAAMREFTVDLQVRKAAHRTGVCRCFVAHHPFEYLSFNLVLAVSQCRRVSSHSTIVLSPASPRTQYLVHPSNTSLQGPTPGGSEPPRPPTPLSAASNQDPGSSEVDASRVEAAASGAAAAAASSSVPGSGGDARSGGPSNGAGLHRGDATGATDGATRGSGQETTGWSFARVTAMNGHFPTLAPSVERGSVGVSASSNSRQAGGAWGASAVAEGGNGRETTVWGAKANEPARGLAADAAGDIRPLAERESGASQSGKKKGRKGKAVSLFSNAGVRGGAR